MSDSICAFYKELEELEDKLHAVIAMLPSQPEVPFFDEQQVESTKAALLNMKNKN